MPIPNPNQPSDFLRRYVPYIATKYLSRMTAGSLNPQYMMDNGDGRRIGTLAVFLDSGVDSDEPILAFPVNLSVLLNLPEGLAFAGFTAGTGEKWQKQDVLNWHWCDMDNCDYPSSMLENYDYHSQSKFYEARHNFNQPGEGFGGGGGKDGPFTGEIYSSDGKLRGGGTVHGSPDTTPWGVDSVSRTSAGISGDLYAGGAAQVPPLTEN